LLVTLGADWEHKIILRSVAARTSVPIGSGIPWRLPVLAIAPTGRGRGLPTTPLRSLPLVLGGVAALVLLTIAGPYPISMIQVAGDRIKNASPPTLALLATAAAQLGLIMLLHNSAQRWLHRRRPWLLVVAANTVVLTIFLWHMSAVLVVAGTLSWAGLLPPHRSTRPPGGSGEYPG
jgi:hypothetical protein